MTTSPPSWSYCGTGATQEDPVGCRGIQLGSDGTCLSHMSSGDQQSYLNSITPGSDIDLSGTKITGDFFSQLLTKLREAPEQPPKFGTAIFNESILVDDVRMRGAIFSKRCSFKSAHFHGEGDFASARFSADADFDGATFASVASFFDATFEGKSLFTDVRFHDVARFTASKHYELSLMRSEFKEHAVFTQVRCSTLISFLSCIFNKNANLGAIVCLALILNEAEFRSDARIDVAAKILSCRRTRWDIPTVLRLRYAQVYLTEAVLSQPLAIVAHPAPFISYDFPVDEDISTMDDPSVSVSSMEGTDASFLTFSDVDLSDCTFAGAFNLDQIHLEGNCTFRRAPQGWRQVGPFPYRWSSRRVIEEERRWRSLEAHSSSFRDGWGESPESHDQVLSLARLTEIYRQLRKCREDAKDEPGAADFYYGEMEMRRHDRSLPLGESILLTLYWAFSGYGLRALRALSWLLAAMATTIILMMGLGIPDQTPKQEIQRVTSGNTVKTVIDKPDPELTLPIPSRFTSTRFEKSVRVVLNSVVFRSSDQDLTTWGTYTEMVSRFSEPILLGLAALAIRGRIKRG
ncbi:pentapeptide repeat-containing protein [Streptomyces pseudovenezuelae]|uniref:pentapeptide repeat-containing protein n=1 Tax=Streptomyces pseudovenezuelae TaxID=67350 RepID=UPI003818F58C